MKDRFDRTIDYMRISITDRCDLRCRYCMPNGCSKVTMDQILSYEEIERICRAVTDGKTGVEMEALTGVSVTLLTIYDMCKALDKGMMIRDIHLVEKTGGKSGEFRWQ